LHKIKEIGQNDDKIECVVFRQKVRSEFWVTVELVLFWTFLNFVIY